MGTFRIEMQLTFTFDKFVHLEHCNAAVIPSSRTWKADIMHF